MNFIEESIIVVPVFFCAFLNLLGVARPEEVTVNLQPAVGSAP